MRSIALAAADWASRQQDVLTVPQARRLGLSQQALARLVRGGRWRRLHRGVVWTKPDGLPSALTVLTAARLFAGGLDETAGVVCFRSAARLWGLDGSARPWRPELAIPLAWRRPQPAGLRYRWPILCPGEVVSLHGMPCTTVERTLRDLASVGSYGERLMIADAALRTGRCDAPHLAALVDQLPAGRRGPYLCADGAAESPFESLLRAELLVAGLPVPVLQHRVTVDGRLVARLDLAWPDVRLAVEADGAAVHGSPAALRSDLRRQNALVGAGWTVLRVTWADLGRIAPVVAAALRAAGGRARLDGSLLSA